MLSRMQIRLIMLVPQATCETAVALLNTFPLFAVMLRMKKTSRIPGGIRFVLKHIGGSEPCVLQLEVCPLRVVMSMPKPLRHILLGVRRANQSRSHRFSPDSVRTLAAHLVAHSCRH